MTETTASVAIPVKTNDVQPFGGAGMTTAQIMNILHSVDPGAAAAAGAAHTNLGEALAATAASLTRHAQTLAQNWTGTAAHGPGQARRLPQAAVSPCAYAYG